MKEWRFGFAKLKSKVEVKGLSRWYIDAYIDYYKAE